MIKAKHPTPDHIVSEALKRRQKALEAANPYDEVWVVFDHDHQPKRHEAYHDANEAGIKVVFSALAFEVWYVLHFEKTARVFRDSEDLLHALKRHFPAYAKARQNDFSHLKPQLDTAFSHAAWLRERAPETDLLPTHFEMWTNVDELVHHLLTL